MSHYYKEIGMRIRQLRLEKKYTQEEMAVLLDVDINMFKEFEEGRKRIFVDCISKIAQIYGVTIDYLVYGLTDGRWED